MIWKELSKTIGENKYVFKIILDGTTKLTKRHSKMRMEILI